MAELLARIDPTLLLFVLLPLGLAAAAWALQMACGVSAVEPPDYWQSLLCVFLVMLSNVLLRFWVNTSVFDPGLGCQLIWPLVMSSAIVALMVRTGPFSAMIVTICEGAFCLALYVGFSMVSTALLTAL